VYRREAVSGFLGTRRAHAWAILFQLVAGCRSLSERSYATKTPDEDELVRERQAAQYRGAAEMFGQVVVFLANGCPRGPSEH